MGIFELKCKKNNENVFIGVYLMIWEKILLIELFQKFKISTFLFFSQKSRCVNRASFDKDKIFAKIELNIEVRINKIQKAGVLNVRVN